MASRYMILKKPVLFPMQSIITAKSTERQGPFVDTGVNLPGYGEIYLTKSEILEMARLVEPSLFEEKETEQVNLTVNGSELIEQFKEGLLNVLMAHSPHNVTVVFSEPPPDIIYMEDISEESGLPEQGDPLAGSEGPDDLLRFES